MELPRPERVSVHKCCERHYSAFFSAAVVIADFYCHLGQQALIRDEKQEKNNKPTPTITLYFASDARELIQLKNINNAERFCPELGYITYVTSLPFDPTFHSMKAFDDQQVSQANEK